MKVLSVRQPWAWTLIFGGNDIENRFWTTKYRGPIAIHASKGLSKTEFDDAAFWIFADTGVLVPEFNDLERGSIIGVVDLVDVLETSNSEWFQGEQINGKKNYGWLIKNPTPVKPVTYKGSLGLRDLTIKLYGMDGLRVGV